MLARRTPGGDIEPGTSEIALETAKISGRAFYLFEGIRKNQNRALHIASSGFDELMLLSLVPCCDFVLSVHGAEGGEERTVYVGGLYERGKASVIQILDASLKATGIVVVDATHHVGGEGIAGVSPKNTELLP